jgi:hypothetical protein
VIVDDSVCIREEHVSDLSRRFGVNVAAAHVPMTITDVETIKRRRLLILDGGRMRVWPSEVHLADGPVEREYRRTLARVNALVKAKTAREAERMAKIGRRKKGAK